MKDIVKVALLMRKRAFAPYSNYKVGAAVKTKTGEIIGGCNIESSSYGLTCCAERVAIYNAISKGFNQFNSIAVSTKNAGYPCGACRQVIWEICDDIIVYICNSKELVKKLKSSDLLPNPFNKSFLK